MAREADEDLVLLRADIDLAASSLRQIQELMLRSVELQETALGLQREANIRQRYILSVLAAIMGIMLIAAWSS